MAQAVLVCPDCGAVVARGSPRQIRCKDCAKKRQADRFTAWRKANPAKMRAHVSRWQKANRDKVSSRGRRYREAHPERIKTRRRRAYRDDPDKAREAVRQWRQANPARARDASAKRRARYLQAYIAPVTKFDIARMMAEQGGKCAVPGCGASLAASYHVDHIIPLAKGGTHEPSNVQLMCPSCNCSKGSKLPSEFGC